MSPSAAFSSASSQSNPLAGSPAAIRKTYIPNLRPNLVKFLNKPDLSQKALPCGVPLFDDLLIGEGLEVGLDDAEGLGVFGDRGLVFAEEGVLAGVRGLTELVGRFGRGLRWSTF